ncbi:hypothetical protein ACFFX1_54735 [Dactylosporangium sucinum]|uniref:Uncharacterized protein n=1 Tax=Dactylosporangium sucinum TaxID=1424081 RepID=A0A917U2M3_9ACTN|nr:hypothetical protein [Dactylosporangium sucinum]GGM53686.1 hypothetical protein GCM10007977_064110 [Dactylosporangium sucinum]
MTTDTWRAVPGTRWQDRAAPMLQDDAVGLDREGNPDPTSTDRRWLWRLEGRLAVGATNDRLRELQRDLAEYLQETCVHQWDDPDGYHYVPPLSPTTPKIRQCRWCSHVEDVTP